ncbi:MAG: hypothetical protein AB7P03_05055 [Kofleriaceae bacterium]
MVRALLSVAAVLVVSACTFTGPKGGNPGWKIYKEFHDRPVPSQVLRVGAMELRLTRVYLRREHTVLKTVAWSAWIRASVVSTEKLVISALDGMFTMTGRSGKAYNTHVTTTGPGRKTWQHQEHTGEPTHLPANVPGEIEIWISFDSSADKPPDEVATLTVAGVPVPL